MRMWNEPAGSRGNSPDQSVSYTAVDPLVIVHVVAAVALLALAMVVGSWGLVRARQIAAPGSGREGRWYAQVLQLSHTLVLATGLLGLALLAEGHRSDDALHVRVYGPFMLVAIVAAYAYRTRDAVLNVRVFAIAAFVVFALGLRAFTTGG
jgi:hypothetical protein